MIQSQALNLKNYYLLFDLLQELFSEDRWTDLIEQFRKENFSLHQVSGNSVFLVSLQCGLSALKTPYPLLWLKCL